MTLPPPRAGSFSRVSTRLDRTSSRTLTVPNQLEAWDREKEAVTKIFAD